jgi:hypothetical protein
MQKRGIMPERIEILLRSGVPADAIVRAAGELDAEFIMIGSHGNSLKQRMWRVLAGSTSRQVVKLGACPVMVASLPQTPDQHELVAWYQEAIAHCLQEHPGQFLIFTAPETARMFIPPQRAAGRKEVAAATAALEHLACRGVLVCQKINGELRCIND